MGEIAEWSLEDGTAAKHNNGTSNECGNTHTSDEGVQQQVVSTKLTGQDIRLCIAAVIKTVNTETVQPRYC